MDEEPTSVELEALSRSRKTVLERFATSALVFDVPPVVAGDGLTQRGNLIDADRRNPNLGDNPRAGGAGSLAEEAVTVFANGVIATGDVATSTGFTEV